MDDIEEEEVAVARLRRVAREAPEIRLMKFQGPESTFTMEEVLDHVERDTELGRVFKEAEKRMLQDTLRRKKTAGLGV